MPAYVEKPAWAVYDAFDQGLDYEEIHDLAEDLRDALIRADALTHAPHYVLAEVTR